MDDIVVENTELFTVTLKTSDPDVTIGDCDGSGISYVSIYIADIDSK